MQTGMRKYAVSEIRVPDAEDAKWRKDAKEKNCKVNSFSGFLLRPLRILCVLCVLPPF